MFIRCATLTALLLLFLSTFSGARQNDILTFKGHNCVAGHVLVKLQSAANTPLNGMTQRQRIMSRFNAKLSRRFQSGVELWIVDPSHTFEMLQSLKQESIIEFVEPDFIYTSEIIPNDPFFENLWGLHNTGQSGGVDDADIDAPDAWDVQRGDKEIIVGIIDSGVDYRHPDLADNIWINPAEIPGNGVDDDGNNYVDDIHGYDFETNTPDPMDSGVHGTHVAGTIGAIPDNSIGSCGIAWDVQLMPLKFMDADGRGSASDAVAAIEYALHMGADILNLSWGGTAYSETLYAGLAAADSAGLLIVCSAGNSSTDNDKTPHYPSSFELDNLISVTASDAGDNLASFANWGVHSVDLSAPGVGILSTAPGEKYGYMSGSSMAVPHVVGTAALLWSHFPEATAVDLKRKILASADKKESLISTSQTAGRLNAFSALVDSSSNELALTPNFIEFGLTLVGAASPSHMVYLNNNSDDTLTIASLTAPDGFLLGRRSEYGVALESFSLPPWSMDSLTITFVPTTAQDYRRFITINYANQQNNQTTTVQLYGRGRNGTLVQSGSISGAWTAEKSPYYILGDVTISGSLTIHPGVMVEFQGAYSMTIGAAAVLYAQGAENDSIFFNAYDEDEGWSGIRFLGSADDDLLDYCAIKNSKKLKSTELEQDQNGGAIYCSASHPSIANCRMTNNYAVAGGAIYLANAHPIIENSTIVNNRALSDGGGGIFCYESNPEIFRVVVSNNRSLNFFADSDNGGGIYCWSSSPTLINVTLAGNVADKGGGIYIAQRGSNPTIVNSILWDNIPNEAEFSNEPKSKSLAVAYSDVEGGEKEIDTGAAGKLYWLDGNMDVNPNFVDQAASDFRLIQDSPCIDAAVHNITITYENGQIRIPAMSYLGDAPDLGACESFMVLPVELTTFSAHQQKHDVILHWSTASEFNNYKFEIYRRDEAKNLQKIGTIPGHGTSVTPRRYSFIDKNVPAGLHSYQLVQIDVDGSRHQSSFIEIDIKPPAAVHLSPGYPNPFNSNTIFRYDIPVDEDVSILIYNIAGQNVKTVLQEKVQAGRHQIHWDGTDDSNTTVASGVYWIVLKAGDQTKSQKIMLLR